MEADHPGALEQGGLGGQHPTLGGGQILGRVEAEGDGIVPRADETAVVLGRDGVRRVLDDVEPMLSRQLPERTEVRGMAGVVHGKDGARARRDRRGDRGRGDVERVRLHIREHRPRPHVLDDVHRRRERHRRRDDFVPGPDLERHQRRVQRCRAGARRQRAGGPQVGGEVRFEPLGLWSRRDPVRAQRVDDLGDLLLPH